MTGVVRLDGSGIRIADIVAVARAGAMVEPGPEVLERLRQARAILEKAAAGGQQIYGMNTGLGANLRTSVGSDDHDFQRRLVMGRGMAVGPALPVAETRAVMASRLAMLAVGGSGISVETFAALAAMLNAGVHPEMPSIGSIGAGDLVQLSAMAQGLIGEGRAERQGEVLPAAEALARAGLQPVALKPKDGISLLNASAVSVGLGALALYDAQALLCRQRQAAALSFEALGGNPLILTPAIQAARPAPHQAREAALILAELDGSSLFEAKAAIQDPLSLRCVAPIHAALAEAFEHAVSIIEVELNAAADNPLVILAEDRVLSTGNFHTPALSLAFETLGLAVAQAAAAAAGRFVQLTGSGRNGLPRYLSPVGGPSAGFVPLQKTVAALMARIRHMANPVMLDFLAVSEGVEDHATQSTLTVEKLRDMLDLWKRLIACELVAAAQAVELRAEHHCGSSTSETFRLVRAHADFASDDRPMGAAVDRLASAL
jgi:histidine ammonia-lyase